MRECILHNLAIIADRETQQYIEDVDHIRCHRLYL